MVYGIRDVLFTTISMDTKMLTKIGPLLDNVFEVVVDVCRKGSYFLNLVAQELSESDQLLYGQCLSPLEFFWSVPSHPRHNGSVA